jgi:hypothetical protein
MTAGRKRWSELTGTQRGAVVALGCLEVVLTATSLADLAGRPAAQVRGPKALWALVVFVQPLGPAAYLTLGRRTG